MSWKQSYYFDFITTLLTNLLVNSQKINEYAKNGGLGGRAGFWQHDPYLRYSYLSYLYLRYLYLRYLYLRYLYQGYYIYETNILDVTRYLCQVVAQFLVFSLTLEPGLSWVDHDHGHRKF